MAVDELNWVGQSLAGGRYRVTALLGEGGMGSVFRARDANLDTDVVIKVPRAGLTADREFAARFAREVRSLVRLAHAHIVRVLDVGEHERLPFAVMQFLPGGNLRERAAAWADGRAALAVLGSWLPDVAAALDYIHAQGYVHRDVKPDNILFDQTGHVYLGDFGIAKALSTPDAAQDGTFKTIAGLVVGTPQYMAPELIANQGCDGRVDQYALAITVYEVVCGRLPFAGPTAAALVVQHATQKPPPPHEVAGVPLAFSAALLRGLAKEPTLRYPDCRSLAQALLAATEGRPAALAARTPPPTPPQAAPEYPCPSCGTVFHLPPRAEGKRLRCRHCGADFKVPAVPPGLPPGSLADTDALVRARMPTPKAIPALRVAQAQPASKPPARPSPGPEAEGGPKPAGQGPPLGLLLVAVSGCVLLLVGAVVGGFLLVSAARRSSEGHAAGPLPGQSAKSSPGPAVPPTLPAPAVSPKPPPGHPVVPRVGPPPTRVQPAATPAAGTMLAIEPQRPVIYSSMPGPYAALPLRREGAADKDVSYQVHDLRQMKPVGLPVLLPKPASTSSRYQVQALGPDGAYLAYQTADARPTVAVCTVATGRSRRVEVDPDSATGLSLVDFVERNQLLVVKRKAGSSRTASAVEVWDWEARRLVRAMTEIKTFLTGPYSGLSPDGRYLAAVQTADGRLHLYDLRTGRDTASFDYKDPKDTTRLSGGIAFSRDGRRLAMVSRTIKTTDVWGRLLCWDVADGKKLYDHPLGDAAQMRTLYLARGVHHLQWLPDGGGWLLFGYRLLDRDSGTPVGTIGPVPRYSADVIERHFLDEDQVATVEGTLRDKFRILTLPRAEIDAAMRQARAGIKTGGR